MHTMLWSIAILFGVVILQDSPPKIERYSLTVVSGMDAGATKKAKNLIERANALGNFEVKWEQREGVDRLIAIYDSKFAARVNNRESILPTVERIGAQQSIEFHRDEDSELSVDMLAEICSYLPWDKGVLPKSIEFDAEFDEDPYGASGISSSICDESSVLAFAHNIEQQVGPIHYIASVSLKAKTENKKATLLVLGIEKKKRPSFKLDMPAASRPVKTLLLDATLILIPNSNSKDDATKYLKNWMSGLEESQQASKAQSENDLGEKKEPKEPFKREKVSGANGT